MISRRNFFSIAILMAIVLFLCMCLNNVKDSWNDYAVNRYTETAENYPSKINVYVPDSSPEKEPDEQTAGDDRGEAFFARDKVICIGDMGDLSMKAAEMWVTYTKRNIAEYPTLTAYEAAGNREELPEMLVLDSGCVDWETREEIDFLNTCLERGIHLVFCNLPDVSVIRRNKRVRELFGIQKVLEDETTVTGIYLREGFLLGGQTFYLEKSGSDADTGLPGSKAFPGEKTFPWYLPDSGTKIYMKGIPEGTEIKAERYPIVMWRKSYGTACLFAVNGGFMDGMEAMGILSAMSAEMYSYEIYPVVNAQNMILTGYPSLADENADEMERLYSCSLKQVFQEIVWPDNLRILREQNYKATCMLTPQYDYLDNNLPDGKQLEYYLKLFNEDAAETGWSSLDVSGISPLEKLEEDQRFFQDVLGRYDIVSFYGGELEDERIAEALGKELLASARTVVRDYDETKTEPLGLLTGNVTTQSVLSDGLEYTYKSDFLLKCMETALGYFSVSFDMSRVAYPDGDEDTWEQMSRNLATTVNTYGKMFQGFDKTTAAECDMHIRQFLALDYSDSRTDNEIHLQVEKIDGAAWFILRTHNETIQKMEGGSWQKLEEGAYLIEVAQSDVTLTLEPADQRFYK